MTWIISIVVAILILVVFTAICVSDKFADIFGTIFYFGLAVGATTFLIHLLLFEGW